MPQQRLARGQRRLGRDRPQPSTNRSGRSPRRRSRQRSRRRTLCPTRCSATRDSMMAKVDADVLDASGTEPFGNVASDRDDRGRVAIAPGTHDWARLRHLSQFRSEAPAVPFGKARIPPWEGKCRSAAVPAPWQAATIQRRHRPASATKPRRPNRGVFLEHPPPTGSRAEPSSRSVAERSAHLALERHRVPLAPGSSRRTIPHSC